MSCAESWRRSLRAIDSGPLGRPSRHTTGAGEGTTDVRSQRAPSLDRGPHPPRARGISARL
jgi:hypothetical protein